MSQYNPYAAPQGQQPFQPYQPAPMGWPMPQAGPGGWVFRDGNTLVMHRMAQLPDVCVKSNQPAEGGRLARTMRWHEPWVYLAILAGLLIYVILALILQQTATVQVGLSPRWFAKRRVAMIIGWLLALAAIGLFIGGIAMIDANDAAGALMIVGSFPTLIIGIAWGSLGSRMVYASRITDQYVWIKGCHPDFLARFRNWPYAGY